MAFQAENLWGKISFKNASQSNVILDYTIRRFYYTITLLYHTVLYYVRNVLQVII